MKDKANDLTRRGSTLGWVILVIMVVMIWLMSALPMSSSHLYRYQRYHNRKQIQMTALSIASAMAEDLKHPSEEGSFGMLMEQMLEDGDEGEVPLNGLNDQMGTASLRYNFDGERLVLTVQVQLGKESGETKLTMRKGTARDGSTAWVILGYGPKEIPVEEMTPEKEEDLP